MKLTLQTHTIGENAIILQLSYDQTSKCVDTVRWIHEKLIQSKITGVVSIRPGLDSILVEYDDNVAPHEVLSHLNAELPHILQSHQNDQAPPTRIPVCYEPEFSLDLENISKQTGISSETLIQLHCSKIYSVWMIGFMPGFPYLGELPSELQIPRKSNPDLKIPAGSVAVAEEYVGVYPFDSPGGWHVVGRTPLTLFDYRRTDPWLFQYGMQVQFYSITKDEFEIIKNKM